MEGQRGQWRCSYRVWADPTEILTSFSKEYLGFSGRTLEVT